MTQLELFVFRCFSDTPLYPNWCLNYVEENSHEYKIEIALTQIVVTNGVCFDQKLFSISKSDFSKETLVEEFDKIWQSVLLEMI
jgi:hypothetical protein